MVENYKKVYVFLYDMVTLVEGLVFIDTIAIVWIWAKLVFKRKK